MKNLVRLMCVCMALMLGFAGMPVAEARTAEGFIRVDGQKLVDENGKEYQIRGMQFHNSWDPWYPSLAKTEFDHDEESFRELQEMGFNAARFTIYKELFDTQEGWQWMDKNIEWGKKYGIRLIPSLHVFYTSDQGDECANAFWNDEETHAEYVAFWQEYARRYADEPYILGYDLLNEPTVWVPNGDPYEAQRIWKKRAENMIAKIREVDDNHIIFMEGVFSVTDIDTKVNVWHENTSLDHLFIVHDQNGKPYENIAYQFHYYYPDAYTFQDMEWRNTTGQFMAYPGYDIGLGSYDWAWGGEGDSYWGGRMPDGWETMTVEYTAAEEVYVAFAWLQVANLEADAKVWFDNLVIAEYDQNGQFVQNILDESFDKEKEWTVNSGGQIVHYPDAGADGKGCIAISNTETSAADGMQLGPYSFTPNHKYIITVDVKSTDATDGYIATGFGLFLKREDGSSYIDQNALEKKLQKTIAFSQNNNVPVYMGEFGVSSAASEEDRGSDRYIVDLLELCAEYEFGYTYWCYHNENFGLWDSTDREKRTNLDEVKWDAFCIGNELNTELEVLTSCAERMDESTALIELDNTKKTTVYAAVVEAGEDKPTIDTSGEGIAVGANGDSFTLAIGEGEQDIYLVLKDAQGNKLNLMFEVEAWRQPAEITGIFITPETAEVTAGARMAFEAQVSGTGTYNAAIAWSVSGQTSASTRMEENTLIIGRDEAAASVTVTAEAAGNPAFTATAEVTVLPRSVTTMPDDLVSIDSEAFEGAAFQAVVLGSNVTGIGGRAFANCAQLIDIVIPETVITIAYDAFDGCRSDLVILGTAGSPAEAFADQQGYIFEILP